MDAILMILTLVVLALPVAIVVLFIKMGQAQRRLEVLEFQTSGLIRELSHLNANAVKAAPAAATSEVAPEVTKVASPIPHVTAPQFTPSPAVPAFPSPQPAPAPVPVFAPKPSRTRAEWESLIGGKVLNRIGALALIIGMGFFLKYAIDNNWISETVRVLIGVGVGLGLLALGLRTRKNGLVLFAQGLAGAGIAVLYLSVYAAFNYYHLVSQPVAFAAMSIVTVIGFQQAVLYDSLAAAMLALAGGFLTPFMLSTGHANEAGLFAYVAMLDAGILFIAVQKQRWVVLELLAACATYLVYAVWYFAYYQETVLALSEFFLALFWILFFLRDVYRNLFAETGEGDAGPQVLGVFTAVINLALFYVMSYVMLDRHHEWAAASLAAMLAALCGGMVVAMRRKGRPEEAILQYALAAMGFLVIATLIQFTGYVTAIVLAGEGVVLFWLGDNKKFDEVRSVGILIMMGAVAKIFATSPVILGAFTPVLNLRFEAYIVSALAFQLAALILSGSGMKNLLTERVLQSVALVLLFLGSTIEVNDTWQKQIVAPEFAATRGLLEYHKVLAIVLTWVTIGLPVYRTAALVRRLDQKPFLVVGAGILSLALVAGCFAGATFVPIEHYQLLTNFRTVVLIALCLALLLAGTRPTRSLGSRWWGVQIPLAARAAAAFVILVLLTGETRDYFQKILFQLDTLAGSINVSSEITATANRQQLAISGIWLVYSIVLMVGGIAARMRGLRLFAIALFGVTILKIFLYDLTFLETLYRIFSFIGLGVILLTVSYLYQRYKDLILASEPPSESV